MAAAPVLSAEMGGDETDDTAGPVARSRPESPKGGSQCPAHANGVRISITCCSCAAVTMESQATVGTECPRTRKSPGSSTAEVAEVEPLELVPKAKPKAKKGHNLRHQLMVLNEFLSGIRFILRKLSCASTGWRVRGEATETSNNK